MAKLRGQAFMMNKPSVPPPFPRPALAKPKRFTWRKQGVGQITFVSVILACLACRDYGEKGRFDPLEYAALGIVLLLAFPIIAFAGWLVNKAE